MDPAISTWKKVVGLLCCLAGACLCLLSILALKYGITIYSGYMNSEFAGQFKEAGLRATFAGQTIIYAIAFLFTAVGLVILGILFLQNKLTAVAASMLGILVDTGGTLLVSLLIVTLSAWQTWTISAAPEGTELSNISLLMAAAMPYFTSIPGAFFGILISVLAGYLTAKVAKVTVYLPAGAVACTAGAVSFSFAMWHPLNITVIATVLSVLAVLLGACLWSIRNPTANHPV